MSSLKNRNKSKRTANTIRYLTIEGGGGKGVTYLGAIRALEDLKILDKFPNYSPRLYKTLKGISGASAGSITAFFLAIGYGYDDIRKMIESSGGLSVFAGFFDFPLDEKAIAQIKSEKDSPFTVIQRKVDYSNKKYVSGVATTDNEVGFYTKKILYLIDYVAEPVVDTFFSDPTVPKSPSSEFNIYNLLFNYEEVYKNYIQNPDASVLSIKNLNDKVRKYYISNLCFGYGLFSGLKIRDFFIEKLRSFLGSLSGSKGKGKTPETLTLKELSDITKLELIFTGTDITSGLPILFSSSDSSSMDFPVVEAICISMNIPVLYKPIIVANKDGTPSKLGVDGGVINNFPLHAFDGKNPTNNNILGLLLHDNFDPQDKLAWMNGIKNKKLNLFRYLFKLIPALTYASGDGQVVNKTDQSHIINFYTDLLDLTEFSPSPFKSILTVLFIENDSSKEVVAAMPGPVLRAYLNIHSSFNGSYDPKPFVIDRIQYACAAESWDKDPKNDLKFTKGDGNGNVRTLDLSDNYYYFADDSIINQYKDFIKEKIKASEKNSI